MFLHDRTINNVMGVHERSIITIHGIRQKCCDHGIIDRRTFPQLQGLSHLGWCWFQHLFCDLSLELQVNSWLSSGVPRFTLWELIGTPRFVIVLSSHSLLVAGQGTYYNDFLGVGLHNERILPS